MPQPALDAMAEARIQSGAEATVRSARHASFSSAKSSVSSIKSHVSSTFQKNKSVSLCLLISSHASSDMASVARPPPSSFFSLLHLV
ncbi:hypothetical protein F2Q68_00025305 [Brassica cretica]|uniref:Uncharacterized protein n=2 Tax=Brassica cretica TaxID=69181 RepID=A0A8S9IJH8_BRACR|nr:hypothetical protein F2Q68_00025305 [Brassica cretica]KAF3581504.1 hypothetical protein DY000_02030998 [Brassica cretica]